MFCNGRNGGNHLKTSGIRSILHLNKRTLIGAIPVYCHKNALRAISIDLSKTINCQLWGYITKRRHGDKRQ